jgi:hypothetical protein
MATWEQLQFLIGSWSSPVSGQPGEGISGWTTFTFKLDQKIMLRNSRAEFAPEPGKQEGFVHEDMLVIYQPPHEADFRAIYFDNEGHIIHYTLSFPMHQPSVVFESEASTTGPRARLVYEVLSPEILTIEFFVAPPGGEFVSHVKGRVVRNA